MKIGIATVQVPFTRGGAEHLAENLKTALVNRGYEADIVAMPFKWYPASTIIDGILAARLIDLTEVNGSPIDRVIGLKFPMYCVNHPSKVTWLLHQHRQAYELWGTVYGDLEHMENGYLVRDLIKSADNKYLSESEKIYTISHTVTERLQKYNNIMGTTLYHPPSHHEHLYCDGEENYIFYPSRLHEIKRQNLIIESLKYTKSNINLILAGSGEKKYLELLESIIEKNGLKDRVKLVGNITEDEKQKFYARATMVYNGPYQEDYGYVTLESFFSKKPLLTHTDSGGPLEFVQNNVNGFAVEADPISLAEKIDYLCENKRIAKDMGGNGFQLMKDLNINWDYVVERLIQ